MFVDHVFQRDYDDSVRRHGCRRGQHLRSQLRQSQARRLPPDDADTQKAPPGQSVGGGSVAGEQPAATHFASCFKVMTARMLTGGSSLSIAGEI